MAIFDEIDKYILDMEERERLRLARVEIQGIHEQLMRLSGMLRSGYGGEEPMSLLCRFTELRLANLHSQLETVTEGRQEKHGFHRFANGQQGGAQMPEKHTRFPVRISRNSAPGDDKIIESRTHGDKKSPSRLPTLALLPSQRFVTETELEVASPAVFVSSRTDTPSNRHEANIFLH